MENTEASKPPVRVATYLRLNYVLISLLLGVSCVLICLGVFLFKQHIEDQEFKRVLLEEGRNYDLAPFDMVDATHYCNLKIKLRYGEHLVQSYIDENSTRVDPKSGLYKVFMIAYVGDRVMKQEKSVHCFVDPEEHVVTHFRSWDRYQTSLVSKAIRFFQ